MTLVIDMYKDPDFRIADIFEYHKERLQQKYGLPQWNGDKRSVVLFDDYVLKIPRGTYGMKQNIDEYMIYSLYKDIYPLAHCELFFDDGIPIIKMERVTVIFNLSDDCPLLPQEAFDSIIKQVPKTLRDIQAFELQFGYTKDNNLVAFDYPNLVRYL
jgi:hypothetical protein